MLKPLIEHRAWTGLNLLYFLWVRNSETFRMQVIFWLLLSLERCMHHNKIQSCIHIFNAYILKLNFLSHSHGTCWSVRQRASVVSCASTRRIWWWDPSANSPSSSGTSSSWGRLTGNSGTFSTRSCAGSAPHAHHSHTHTLSTMKVPYCHQWFREKSFQVLYSGKTFFRL